MKKTKKILPYLINISITIIIIFTVFYIKKIYPFSQIHDIASFDAMYQYKPLLYKFISSIKNGTISTYSFNNALGMPILFDYIYYLASPINLIALLFKTPEAMFLSVTIAKLIIASVTSTFYTRKKINNTILNTICSIGYVFCAWFIAYGFNIMWLDAFMIFPLFQYGLEELFSKRKYNIYIFTLAYIMYTNFYIAFIICTYTLIYYLFNLIFEKISLKEKILKLNTIILSTIVTFSLAFVALYTTYSVFLKTGIPINSINNNQTILSFYNTLKGFFYGNIKVNLTNYNVIIPNLSTSILFLISLGYYFINNKISKKDKIKTIIAITFTIITLHSKTLNYLINCFHTTAGYSFRYSFIFSFYTIIIFLKNASTFENKIDKKIYIINTIVAIIPLIIYLHKKLDLVLTLFSIISVICYTLFFIFYKEKNKIYKIIFISIFCLECGYCYLLYAPTAPISVSQIDKSTDIKEYRITNSNNFDTEYLNQLYSNENKLIAFSSMLYTKSLLLLNQFGCATDLKATIFTCDNNDIFNTLFNIKNDTNHYLPKIYAVDNTIYKYKYDFDSFIINQNLLVLGMSNIENIIEENIIKLDKEIADNTYQYKLNKINKYQIIIDPNIKYILIGNTIYTSDKSYIPKEYKDYQINLKIFQKRSIIFENKKNDTIEISYFDNNKDTDLILYSINNTKYEELYNYLKQGQINYTHYTDSHIEGTINVNKNQLIFTSIPYDESWEIKIDGKIVKPIILLDSLIGIECEPGEHTISMQYKSNYKIPIIISITTFIGLLLNIIIRKRKKKNA